MLKSPYKLIHEEGNSRYYYLKFDDNPVTYLAIETYESVIREKRGLFGRIKRKFEDIVVSVKLMPITALVAFVISVAALDEPIEEYDSDTNSYKKEVYRSWNAFDIQDLIDTFKEYLENVGDDVTYEFPYKSRNSVARAFDVHDLRGVHYLGIEHHGRFSRTHWLVGRDTRGSVTFTTVEEYGTRDKHITGTVMTNVLSLDLVKLICKDIADGKFLKEATPENVEVGEPEGMDLSEENNEI